MTNKIIKLKNEEENCECPTCSIIQEYTWYLKDAETHGELIEIVTDLVNEAKDLGVKEYLIHDIDNKIHLLKHLDGEHCEDCCDDDDFCDC